MIPRAGTVRWSHAIHLGVFASLCWIGHCEPHRTRFRGTVKRHRTASVPALKEFQHKDTKTRRMSAGASAMNESPQNQQL
jgi:hypothetical protein